LNASEAIGDGLANVFKVRGASANNNSERNNYLCAIFDRILRGKRQLKGAWHSNDRVHIVAGSLQGALGAGQQAIRDVGVPRGDQHRYG
jgi:hypothetical protein